MGERFRPLQKKLAPGPRVPILIQCMAQSLLEGGRFVSPKTTAEHTCSVHPSVQYTNLTAICFHLN